MTGAVLFAGAHVVAALLALYGSGWPPFFSWRMLALVGALAIADGIGAFYAEYRH